MRYENLSRKDISDRMTEKRKTKEFGTILSSFESRGAEMDFVVK